MDRDVAENLECDNKSIVCGSVDMIESICITNSISNYSPYAAGIRLIAIRPPINATAINPRWLSMKAATALSSVSASTTCVALMTSFRLESLSVPGGASYCRTYGRLSAVNITIKLIKYTQNKKGKFRLRQVYKGVYR